MKDFETFFNEAVYEGEIDHDIYSHSISDLADPHGEVWNWYISREDTEDRILKMPIEDEITTSFHNKPREHEFTNARELIAAMKSDESITPAQIREVEDLINPPQSSEDKMAASSRATARLATQSDLIQPEDPKAAKRSMDLMNSLKVNSERMFGRPWDENMEKTIIPATHDSVAAKIYDHSQYEERKPVLVLGEPGIGKTVSTRAAADNVAETYQDRTFVHFHMSELKMPTKENADVLADPTDGELANGEQISWGEVVKNPGSYYVNLELRITLMDLTELLGAIAKKDVGGDQIAQKVFPEGKWSWRQFLLDRNSAGLLFFDEVNLVDSEIWLANIMPFLDDTPVGVIGSPSDWTVVAAANLGNEYSKMKFNLAQLDRFDNNVLVFDVDNWLPYAQKLVDSGDMHPAMLEYIKAGIEENDDYDRILANNAEGEEDERESQDGASNRINYLPPGAGKDVQQSGISPRSIVRAGKRLQEVMVKIGNKEISDKEAVPTIQRGVESMTQTWYAERFMDWFKANKGHNLRNYINVMMDTPEHISQTDGMSQAIGTLKPVIIDTEIEERDDGSIAVTKFNELQKAFLDKRSNHYPDRQDQEDWGEVEWKQLQEFFMFLALQDADHLELIFSQQVKTVTLVHKTLEIDGNRNNPNRGANSSDPSYTISKPKERIRGWEERPGKRFEIAWEKLYKARRQGGGQSWQDQSVGAHTLDEWKSLLINNSDFKDDKVATKLINQLLSNKAFEEQERVQYGHSRPGVALANDDKVVLNYNVPKIQEVPFKKSYLMFYLFDLVFGQHQYEKYMFKGTKGGIDVEERLKIRLAQWYNSSDGQFIKSDFVGGMGLNYLRAVNMIKGVEYAQYSNEQLMQQVYIADHGAMTLRDFASSRLEGDLRGHFDELDEWIGTLKYDRHKHMLLQPVPISADIPTILAAGAVDSKEVGQRKRHLMDHWIEVLREIENVSKSPAADDPLPNYPGSKGSLATQSGSSGGGSSSEGGEKSGYMPPV